MMADRHEFETQMQHHLNEVRHEIDQMQRLIHAEARIEYRNQMMELQDHREHFEHEFAQLLTASDDSWQDLQAGVEKAWDELQESFDQAAARFEQA
jgi:hypothetical protein